MASASLKATGTVLLACCVGMLVHHRPAAAQQQSAQQPVVPAQAAPPTVGWPHSVTVNGADVVIYQPQVISWPGQTRLNARAAVSITRPGGATPILGTVEVTAATHADFTTRSVILSEPRLVSSHFPSLDTAQAAHVEARIKASLPDIAFKRVPLDSILLSLRENAGTPPAPALNNDPPVIFYSARPASLVVFDGEPVLAPVGNTGLSFAVNTNWDVFRDPEGNGIWYLLDDGAWYSAAAYSGPYSPAATLPQAFSALPDDQNFAHVRRSIPGKTVTPDTALRIFVSTKPAEIIVTAGPPVFAPIGGTSLQYVTNTNAALFRESGSGHYYYLVSGRWFGAPGLDGPWSFATPNLPADFARIPPESPVGNVLPSVPGTAQAQEAVLQAQIPRQATLNRKTAQLHVTYVGPPQFRPIPGTSLAYAVNTTYEVLEVGGKYYACYQGAWFVAATPNGPWTLADSVPEAIYQIPPSHPLYNVTYVRPYAVTPTTVTYGYTAGYLAGFVSAGVLVYGTGYYYPPVVVPGPVPAYLPYPYSYAGGVYYNPATGAWGRGGAAYGPYGAATYRAAYNPATGAYARGGAVYGPYGGAGAWSAYNPATGGYAHGSAAWGPDGGTAHGSFYNPRTGISGSTTQNANPYERWGSSVISGPNQTVNTASGSNARGSAGAFSSTSGAAGVGVRGTGGTSAGVARGAGGNVYAGADGNVYRHTSDGWSQWSNGSWQSVQPPSRSGSSSATAGQPPQAGSPQPGQRGAATGSGSATRQQSQANLQTAQPGRTEAGSPASTRQPQAGQPGASWEGARNGARPNFAREPGGSFGQLEQDRQARLLGEQRQRLFAGGHPGGWESGEFGLRGMEREGGGRGFGGFHRR